MENEAVLNAKMDGKNLWVKVYFEQGLPGFLRYH